MYCYKSLFDKTFWTTVKLFKGAIKRNRKILYLFVQNMYLCMYVYDSMAMLEQFIDIFLYT